MITIEDSTPPLYKIISRKIWNERLIKEVPLCPLDTDFIHLATKEQLPKVLKKFWKDIPVVILELDSSKLQGDLRLEINPGGTNQYYHLYYGHIPIEAIIEIT